MRLEARAKSCSYVVAPSDADVTRSTYLRKTPLGQRRAGGLKPFRRAGDFFVADLDVEPAVGNVEWMMSPSRTAAMGRRRKLREQRGQR